uniref:Uncharacterized protein n=1 Tax=Panagrolaimus superbus TaxID=310955 RepID=A0A914YIX8_9BILA
MFYKTLLTLLLTIPLIAGSLINKVGLPCDPPPVPQYIPDGGYGTYCRFNASYSQVDITFIIDVSEKIDEIRLNYVRFNLIFRLLFHFHFIASNNIIQQSEAFAWSLWTRK